MLKVTLLTLGNKMPQWVEQAFATFEKRLRDYAHFRHIEIPLIKRNKNSELERILKKEKEQVIHVIPKNAYLIALDVEGTPLSSEKMAERIEKVQNRASHICFLMGGPEGIDRTLLNQSRENWSLSSLTMPHTIARIVFIEALYRSFTILNNHPYHRS